MLHLEVLDVFHRITSVLVNFLVHLHAVFVAPRFPGSRQRLSVRDHRGIPGDAFFSPLFLLAPGFCSALMLFNGASAWMSPVMSDPAGIPLLCVVRVSSRGSRKKPPCHLEAMKCLADLTHAVGAKLSPYMKKLFEPLFSNGLAEQVRRKYSVSFKEKDKIWDSTEKTKSLKLFCYWQNSNLNWIKKCVYFFSSWSYFTTDNFTKAFGGKLLHGRR